MVDLDILYTVAQVGVTYAGFSTLVTVVAYRSDMKALPARIYYMLLLSVIVIACAFLPAILLAYGVSESAAWRISSGLFAALWCWYWINAIVILKTRFRVWNSRKQGKYGSRSPGHVSFSFCWNDRALG